MGFAATYMSGWKSITLNHKKRTSGITEMSICKVHRSAKSLQGEHSEQGLTTRKSPLHASTAYYPLQLPFPQCHRTFPYRTCTAASISVAHCLNCFFISSPMVTIFSNPSLFISYAMLHPLGDLDEDIQIGVIGALEN